MRLRKNVQQLYSLGTSRLPGFCGERDARGHCEDCGGWPTTKTNAKFLQRVDSTCEKQAIVIKLSIFAKFVIHT